MQLIGSCRWNPLSIAMPPRGAQQLRLTPNHGRANLTQCGAMGWETRKVGEEVQTWEHPEQSKVTPGTTDKHSNRKAGTEAPQGISSTCRMTSSFTHLFNKLHVSTYRTPGILLGAGNATKARQTM